MADLDRAVATQLKNIETRTGKTLAELGAIIKQSDLKKHGQLVSMLKADLGLGQGDANTLVHTVLHSSSRGAAKGLASAEVLDQLYTGAKAALRPIHEALMAEIGPWGDFDEAPKKAYVSYRRKKQFATIGPATNSRVDLGLNVKGLQATDRLVELPPGKMCNYKVKLTDAAQVDQELFVWIRAAYDSAG
jgi:predicted transport protein